MSENFTKISLSESPSTSDKYQKAFVILNLISLVLLIIILGIIFNERWYEKDKFQYIYYMSKIMTIKSIIIDNHSSEALETFATSGEPQTLPTTYKNLLKLVKNKNGCVSNYKPCGTLDTYGNVLCIDELLNCPINQLKVDHINKASYYSNDYDSVTLEEMTPNYQLYYSNKFDHGNIVTLIIKTKDEPKYITNKNFILDTEAFKEIFGDKELLDKIADVFGLKDDDKKEEEILDDDDNVITIFKKLADIIDDDNDNISDNIIYLKGAKLLYKIINYQYTKNVEKFNDYVKEQLEILDEKNNDKFFEYIGGDFYAKNYIGFKNVEDINKFLKFDYDIYKKRFPNFQASVAALVGLIFLCLLIIVFFFCLIDLKESFNCFRQVILIILYNLMYHTCALGFFIYALYAYINVNKNGSLDELKTIKSDEFINDMIDDFISECKNSKLIICTFVIDGTSIVLNIISLIIYKKFYSNK